MMSKTGSRLKVLAFCCYLAYFASYMTRINYAAVRLAIADELMLTHPELVIELGIAISAVSITYGLGQFISGVLGDRIPPILLVCAGLGGAILCNLLIPVLYPSVYWMALVWGINGFFQSLIRPPLGRIIAANYDEKGYINTCVGVSNSSQVATVLTYLLIPLYLKLFHHNWRPAFYLPAMISIIGLAAWMFLVPRLVIVKPSGTESISEKKTEKNESLYQVMMKSGLCIFLPAVLIHGFLRDGITAFMPDFIAEVGGLGTGVSILTTAILPMFCIVSVLAAKKLCAKIPSDGKSSAILFGISGVASLLIVLLLDHVNAVVFAVLVVLMALITSCMHAANHIFITRIPGAFNKAGRVSSIVGILNAITYIGSALSPYAIALLAGHGGWNNAVLLWVVLAALSMLLCIAACRKWYAYKVENR